MTEAEFQKTVLALARAAGWRVFHHTNARRATGMATIGWPDLVLVRERTLFRELKTDTGLLRGAQQEWIDALRAAGADAEVWRPADLPRIKQELGGRASGVKW